MLFTEIAKSGTVWLASSIQLMPNDVCSEVKRFVSNTVLHIHNNVYVLFILLVKMLYRTAMFNSKQKQNLSIIDSVKNTGTVTRLYRMYGTTPTV